MGNKGSSTLREQHGKPDIPEITVIPVSWLPGMGHLRSEHTGLRSTEKPAGTEGHSAAGTEGHSAAGTEGRSPEDLKISEAQLTVCEEGQQESQWDLGTLSGMEDTPKGSRRHFLEMMIRRSPEVRRRMDERGLVHLSRSNSLSLVSTNMEEDRTPVTLDPVEHEWMLCSSDGEWASLLHLLSTEPSLVLRKDFVTGFSCLHWAAKLGQPELIAQIVDFSRQHSIPVSVDIQSNSGYTPLHIAAMHGHLEVLKLLVGAYSANVEVRDYSGRKASQYLADSVSVDILDICGAHQTSESNDHRAKGQWRFSKVLQSNLKPLKLLSPADSLDGEDRSRDRPVRRQSSLSRIRPKLEKLRRRTSKIVHNASHQDQEVLEGSRFSQRSLEPRVGPEEPRSPGWDQENRGVQGETRRTEESRVGPGEPRSPGWDQD